jgi:hypothetical protein
MLLTMPQSACCVAAVTRAISVFAKSGCGALSEQQKANKAQHV